MTRFWWWGLDCFYKQLVYIWVLRFLKHLAWLALSEVAKISIFSNLIWPSENDAQTSWPIFKSLPIIFSPILTATSPSALLDSSPARLSSSLLPKQDMYFSLFLHHLLILFPYSGMPFPSPVHVLSRNLDDNSWTKQELLRSSRRCSLNTEETKRKIYLKWPGAWG